MTEDPAEQIRQRMQQQRNDLDDSVLQFVSSARRMTDWRQYVRAYPWASIGMAAAAGFLVVPRRIQIVSPDTKTLLELAKHNKLVVKTDPKPEARGGFAGPLFTFIANAAVRGVISYLGQKSGKAAAHGADSASQEASVYRP